MATKQEYTAHFIPLIYRVYCVTVDAKRCLGWQTYFMYYSSFIERAIEVDGDQTSWPALDSSQILGGFSSIEGS